MQQNSTKFLDYIISSQRPYYDRSRLGYNQMKTEKGSISKKTGQEEEQRIYEENVKGPRRTQEENHKGTGPPIRFITHNQ
jgi:hypothetical protein